jgi:4-diphosphocytidyl-2-C-methyl-D-erythritol kinase
VLRWAGCRDLTLAASLGADVPFCLLGGRARVRGVGELVEPLAFRPAAYVLALVPLAVDTPAVYRAFDRAGAVGPDPGGNDLTAAALAVEPALAGWRDALARATGRTPRLAGSGATWFVEGPGPPDLPDHLELGGRRAALVRAQAVPAGWGDPPKVTGRDDPAP